MKRRKATPALASETLRMVKIPQAKSKLSVKKRPVLEVIAVQIEMRKGQEVLKRLEKQNSNQMTWTPVIETEWLAESHLHTYSF